MTHGETLDFVLIYVSPGPASQVTRDMRSFGREATPQQPQGVEWNYDRSLIGTRTWALICGAFRLGDDTRLHG